MYFDVRKLVYLNVSYQTGSWFKCYITIPLNMVVMLLLMLVNRYEGQRDMLYNQTFNLDQVAFASEGIKDAQQTVHILFVIIVVHFLPPSQKKKEKVGLSMTNLA